MSSLKITKDTGYRDKVNLTYNFIAIQVSTRHNLKGKLSIFDVTDFDKTQMAQIFEIKRKIHYLAHMLSEEYFTNPFILNPDLYQ